MPQFFGSRPPEIDDRPDLPAAAHRALLDAPDLRRLPDALGWIARELVDRFGFDRVMVLRPDAGTLAISRTEFRGEPELAREAQQHAERHPVELRTDSLEVEMMRRRAPALVLPAGDRRAWAPITEQLRTPAYVAATVEAFGRTVATLHADTFFSGREVDGRDRSAIGVLARIAMGLVERALLFEQIARLEAGARAGAAQLLALADGGPGALTTAPTEAAPRPAAGGGAWPLTPRETEVLELMSRGATGQEIARRLVVSSGTVKTHARNILRKLGAGTRAEAVARAIELRPRVRGGRDGEPV